MKKYVNKWQTMSVEAEQWEGKKEYPENSIIKHFLDNGNISKNADGSWQYYIFGNDKEGANCPLNEGDYFVKIDNWKHPYVYYHKELFENMFVEVE